jgi:hypothetical protein
VVVLTGIRRTGSRANRPLCGRAATSLEHARVLAGMDAEQQPHDHGRALLGVRSVLPRQRPLEFVRPWVYAPDTSISFGTHPPPRLARTLNIGFREDVL